MDMEKFTRKTKEALASAHVLASTKGHAETKPLHLAISLLNDAQGLFRQAILNTTNNTGDSLSSLNRVLAKSLSKIPSKSPRPDAVPDYIPLIKVVCGRNFQKYSRDTTHIAVDQLILSLLEESQIAGCFKEAGVSVARVLSEVEKLLRKKEKNTGSASTRAYIPVLQTHGHDLVEQAGKLDAVIGPDEEIRRVITILSLRKNNSAILIREPGVGRTAVVEGLARRIACGDVPSYLAGVRLIALDMVALIARRVEWRLEYVIRELGGARGKVILFIDDICEGSMEAMNLLKPMLARGQLMCIGATTLGEYRKYVEKDAAFERMFQRVYVAEPSVTDTISILRGQKASYEGHHGVRIQDRALLAAAHLSHRYITGRPLPDKAIDLVDEACANVRVQLHRQPEEIDNIERKRILLKLELHALEEEEDKASKARIVEHMKELDDLRDTLLPLKLRHMKKKEMLHEIQKLNLPRDDWRIMKLNREAGFNLMALTVRPEQIAEVVSRWTGIPEEEVLHEYQGGGRG